MKVAVSTKGRMGLDDEVSNVFGRAETFTIVELDGGNVKSVNVVENPALSYTHGAGPIAVKTLVDAGVDFVITSELGIGVSTLLQQHNIKCRIVRAGTKMRDAIEELIREGGR